MLCSYPLRLAFGLLAALAVPAPAQDPPPVFTGYEAARPVLQAMASSLPAALRDSPPDAVRWSRWLKEADAAVRQRLQAGEEDTLTNLLRFGVTFTSEYRIDDEYFARYGHSTLVNAFAERRAQDLVRALASPGGNQGFIEMRGLLARQGFSLQTAPGRAAARLYLLKNLARMHEEFLRARADAKSNRSHMFQDRGISLDSNLWPDYDLDVQLRLMVAKGMLKPLAVRRVAIVGPGLDFVNKQEGVDYYPPQTVQPFAVLDSLLRLGLSDGSAIEIDTLDISSLANAHLASIRRSAAAGLPQTVQLPWLSGGRWSPDFRSAFTSYWSALGSRIGQSVAPLAIPRELSDFQSRAIRIEPRMVSVVHPIDMNIVYQFLPVPPGRKFDLIIGTNIFLYYGAFEQTLAARNTASMLKPGAFLLSNDKLPENAPTELNLVMTTDIQMTGPPVIADSIFCYRNRP